jgi:uncharacterized membrane protein (DUF4010 family)
VSLNFDWLQEQGLGTLPEFLLALAIGLLMGLERERNPNAKAGLRTFTLIALIGAATTTLAGLLDAPSMISTGLAVVALIMIAAYYHHSDTQLELDSGTTTIAAAIVCYLLAVMAMTDHARLAAMSAIIATSLMYFKAELHGVAHKLERRDLVSILQFAAVAFVALPLMPDKSFGPYGALNPHHFWLMVVLISGVSLFGYAALRLIGSAHGAVLLGVFGGLVSSTATTLAYSRYVGLYNQQDQHGLKRISSIAATVVIAANLVLLVRVTMLAAFVAPATLRVLAPVTISALLAGIAVAACRARSDVAATELTIPEIKNPTELRAALVFSGIYVAVLLLSAWLVDIAGSMGMYTASLVSGLTDVDAITLSSLRLFGLGSLSSSQVTVSMVLAISANSVFKLGVVWVVGGRELFGRCFPAMATVVVVAALALLLFA